MTGRGDRPSDAAALAPDRLRPIESPGHGHADGKERAGAPSLLAAWRDPEPISDRSAVDLRELLLGPVLLPRRGWRDTVRDDGPRVIGVGIAYVIDGKTEGPAADVVFSAVLLQARRGNAAAALVLDHARRHRGTTIPLDTGRSLS